MAHSFLLDAGYWTLQGHWLDRDQSPVSVKGRTLISWREDWFTMVTKLVFPNQEREEIALQYRGHIDQEARLYTFVLMHSVLGRVEGEGWIAPDSIVQRYWVLGDRQRRSGVETLYRLSDSSYHISNATMTGHYLTSTMEATLSRQAT
ncbi:hypothetical protein [Prochlorothrix hollandica]|uniref:Uncharacterized protein n=1 Tax=Prochlorothrix hollandica PCC 9006 = CALU 1027 TaxID=317619 RepID=A0A0M2PYW1_PROHO|nr:hypothetical protein [Prochlorothrix hollandica]KKJ01330.1 hypothetical protein PROH_02960 [Prochlorothrix hollandica PCC 9006 = CALU 1027]